MSASTLESGVSPHDSGEQRDRLGRLSHVIDHAGHLLPAQGPITVFIHHNTLHAFEDLPFDAAVRKGAAIFGCHPYLPEDRYREKLARGRIRSADLEAVLRMDLGSRADESILSLTTRLELRLAMLQYPLRIGPPAELRWFVAETDALNHVRGDAPPGVRERLIESTQRWIMRDVRVRSESDGTSPATPANEHVRKMLDQLFLRFGAADIEQWSDTTWEGFALQALWRVCTDGVHSLKPSAVAPPVPIRHRDLLLQATGADSDSLVQDLMIRFCAAFLDQGFAHWELPQREEGFFRAFSTLYTQRGGPPDSWLRGLADELNRLDDVGKSPLESILESLDLLGILESEWDGFVSASLLVLRGWAGMIRQVESRGDRVAHPIREGSLIEMLAVQLLLERLALEHVARTVLGFSGPLNQLRSAANRRISRFVPPTVEQRAFLEFQLAQVLGWTPDQLNRLTKPEWSRLVEEIESFSSIERRRLFHLAFERRYRTQVLDALTIHSRDEPKRVESPQFQAIFCLDEREESMRRNLEETAPRAETFGVAGFFSVAMYYRGTASAHFVPLCPAILRPQHWVVEDVTFTSEVSRRRRARTRRFLGTATHQVHVGSRTFTGGALLTAGIGILASVPLVARILFPRLTARIRRTAHRFFEPPPSTRLRLERRDPSPGPEGSRIGFTVDEMTAVAERVLRDIGLTMGFARLVIAIGHGSSSLNNPHESAHDCGACGGGVGGPNARAFAQMVNDPRVRERLALRGLTIPAETVFVGAVHNTCDDAIIFFDLDNLPSSHFREFEESRELLEQACDRNAHERCRRFHSAPLTLSFAAARRHVEERSEDLAQVRPEYGHATNACCVVGRRARTRGLFMDRRAFLTSYDPTEDDTEHSILARILAAAVPVCGGINLEYYFSYVDPIGWGCGTKLPHNVTSLLGVMDGAASDLRTGLPWQMVEVHEPVRILFVVEATPETLLAIMDRNATIGQLCRNEWVQMVVWDPHSTDMHVFRDGAFQRYQPEITELPKAASSVDWYRGWRNYLDFAEIEI